MKYLTSKHAPWEARIALLVVVFIAVWVFASSQTDCARADASCQVGTSEEFADGITVLGDIQVGSTPTAGDANQYLVSGGSGSAAQWRDGSIFMLKGTDETVSASTTLQNDDDFSFTADAGAIYLVELFPVITNSTTGGAGYNWTGTGYSSHCSRGAQTPTTVATQACGQSTFSQTTLSTSDIPMPIDFVITADSDGGTITLQWAQNSASGTTTMRSESMMVVTEVS